MNSMTPEDWTELLRHFGTAKAAMNRAHGILCGQSIDSRDGLEMVEATADAAGMCALAVYWANREHKAVQQHNAEVNAGI